MKGHGSINLKELAPSGVCVYYASVESSLGLDPVLVMLMTRVGSLRGKVKIPWQFLLMVQILLESTTRKMSKSGTLAGGTRMNHKHGTRQRKVWRKLHLCINEDGEILRATLTSHIESDTGQVSKLLEGIEEPITEMIGDGGYDSPSTYESLEIHQKRCNQNKPIQAIIPPNTGFQEAKETDSAQRLSNIRLIEDKGKLSWQNQMDYGRRARVENTMYRYKAIIGNKLRSKNLENQNMEIQIGVQILNRMAQLGMPKARKAA
jgi:hypothetical protein